MKTRIVLGLSGASGMPYALMLLDLLAARPDVAVHCIVSDGAWEVLQVEMGLDRAHVAAHLDARCERRYSQQEIGAGPASGSWRHAGMVVCPCSMASLAAIAQGLGANLLHRSADVTLKERRPLILVVRETPFNRIHLQNMLAAHDAGATIVAASPGFYHRPTTIDDLTRHLATRLLDHLGLPDPHAPRWQDG
ncbi:UbiX family flavin prenyltransferase [Megalodesulfovibrio gigas]|uniref:Flavin prenyltransferase UbiX n=1 Tax=Megalodesulfovibrio gigas (strain ATCC 19364 / DSM 1382 / NCIMB 9332 / VKM B-1759) TaxID=1121448 RepID=T2GA23_MEGG1|nr:UbiX family flavin prenyltransferase [Megalodesulfovibrio gigas]AGW12976.1 putative 3-octaprenyl-4-hydroxybenzoate carboxy-lyase [Megalodesulfovibrio gigas DSM 1382 = ATCC 19364]